MIVIGNVTPAQRAEVYRAQSADQWQCPSILDGPDGPQPGRAGAEADLAASMARSLNADGQAAGETRMIPLSNWRYGPRIVMRDSVATVHIVGPMDGFFGFNADRMTEILDWLDPSEIMLDIATPGGYTEQAFRTVLDMERRKADGVPVNTRAGGLVASAGTIVFAVGTERTAPAGASFMAHAPMILALSILNRRNLEPTRARHDAYLQNVEAAMAAIWYGADVSVGHVEQWLDGEDHWMTPGEALEAGLATDAPGSEPESEAPAEPADDVPESEAPESEALDEAVLEGLHSALRLAQRS